MAQAVFDELIKEGLALALGVRGMTTDRKELYLLLLHKFGIWTVVDNVRSEDGGCKLAVDFLGVDVLQLSIENELISFNAEIYGCFLA